MFSGGLKYAQTQLVLVAVAGSRGVTLVVQCAQTRTVNASGVLVFYCHVLLCIYLSVKYSEVQSTVCKSSFLYHVLLSRCVAVVRHKVCCGTSRGCVAKPVLRDAAVCACAVRHDVGTQCTLIGSDEIDPEEESDDSDVECDPFWEPVEEDTGTEDDDIVDDPELEFLRFITGDCIMEQKHNKPCALLQREKRNCTGNHWFKRSHICGGWQKSLFVKIYVP
nr:PREDICTED: uncharacterized protein LOC106704184 [Latimeria chalumnae]|eukprot:XP_014346110.1 PREDICTED: uncharacterized protein LOC106704184 [Latimeria chalumnae]